MRRLSRFQSRSIPHLLTVLTLFTCCAGQAAHAQTVRSTSYDGSGGVQYPVDIRFNQKLALTLEAWVLRQDAGRCETFIAQDPSKSFMLGVCFDANNEPRLSFSRSGGLTAFATANVRANIWTHVAATYDGTTVRFFIDGIAAGVATLANKGVGTPGPVTIGTDTTGRTLLGRLDEIRVWSIARTQQQIQAGMVSEIKTGTGLIAVFDTGGPREIVKNVEGTLETGVSSLDAPFGILPLELTIPRAALTPTIDGSIFTSTEYAGAEQMVVRFRHATDPARDFDFRAYFARDDEFLYAALNVSALPSSHFVEETAVGLFIDPNKSRDPLTRPDDFLISSFTNKIGSSFRVGDGNGNWMPANVEPPADQWLTASTNCSGFEIFFGSCHEFRISKALLGDFKDFDGLAIGPIDMGDGGGSQIGPIGATRTSPATWAVAAYADGSATLPRVRVSGRVLGYTYPGVDENLRNAVDVTAPLADLPVTFSAGDRSLSYRVLSDQDGNFSFDVRMPANVPLGLSVFPSCVSCRMRENPLITSPVDSVTPTSIRPEAVGFPGQPTNSEVLLASVDFRVLQPADPLLMSEVPPAPSISVKLRTDTNDVVQGDIVRINGRNLHDDFEVFLSPFDTTPTEEAWILYPATVVARSPDGSFVDVRMPVVPRVTPVRQTLEIPAQPIGALPTFQINWRWVIKDKWPRPDYRVYTTSRNFGVEPPKDYPKVFGFGFDNGGTGAGLDDFTAVYGFNAYICIDPFGDCDAHIPDPIYMGLWLPVYKLWVGSVEGSCNGLSALSLLFRHGFERPSDYDPNVIFPAGFKTIDYKDAEWRSAGFTHPAEPRNLVARIRQLHGVQTSDEFISEFLRDADENFAWPPVEGEPVERLEEIRLNPIAQVISMMDGTGHVVTPYRVEGADASVIKVYDNNSPRSLSPEIVVDRTANTYRFDNGNRGGTRIFTFPLSIFQNERTMPGIEDIIDYMWFFVVGDANVTYSTADGRRWGRDAEGNPISENPSAIALLPQGQVAGGEPRNFPWIVKKEAPDIRIEARPDGGEYAIHAAGRGTVLQLTVPQSIAGAVDTGEIRREDGRAKTLRFAPQNDSGVVHPKIGMVTGDKERVVLEFSGTQLIGGGAAEFTADPAKRGASLKNESNAPITYTLVAQTVDGNSGNHGRSIFGPFEVPANSVQRVEIADWPVAGQISSTLDLGADGIDDAVAVVEGIRCETGEELQPVDTDGDGVPDACAPIVPTTAVDHVRIVPASEDGGPTPTGAIAGPCSLSAAGLMAVSLAGLLLTCPRRNAGRRSSKGRQLTE